MHVIIITDLTEQLSACVMDEVRGIRGAAFDKKNFGTIITIIMVSNYRGA